mmetsp:Transcript_53986/g.166084  ORF Transcript_53986/g.166084 Transcript_53986/m.166084 type:complete len:282 (+) Transcript_53986:195-1040(+)
MTSRVLPPNSATRVPLVRGGCPTDARLRGYAHRRGPPPQATRSPSRRCARSPAHTCRFLARLYSPLMTSSQSTAAAAPSLPPRRHPPGETGAAAASLPAGARSVRCSPPHNRRSTRQRFARAALATPRSSRMTDRRRHVCARRGSARCRAATDDAITGESLAVRVLLFRLSLSLSLSFSLSLCVIHGVTPRALYILLALISRVRELFYVPRMLPHLPPTATLLTAAAAHDRGARGRLAPMHSIFNPEWASTPSAATVPPDSATQRSHAPYLPRVGRSQNRC